MIKGKFVKSSKSQCYETDCRLHLTTHKFALSSLIKRIISSKLLLWSWKLPLEVLKFPAYNFSINLVLKFKTIKTPLGRKRTGGGEKRGPNKHPLTHFWLILPFCNSWKRFSNILRRYKMVTMARNVLMELHWRPKLLSYWSKSDLQCSQLTCFFKIASSTINRLVTFLHLNVSFVGLV